MKNFFRFLFIVSCTFLWSQERKSTATENVKIISENFDVPQLKTTRRIWIYLPKDYETSRKKYEVIDRKSTRLNSSHSRASRMPSSA